MSKINNKNKKRLAVLSSAALGVLIASAVTTSVSAKVTSYIVNDNGKIISFASDDLIADYTNKLLGKASPMFDAYLEKASGLTAFQDSIKGYVSYESVYEAYLDALLIHEGNNFNIDSVTENAGAEDIKDITVGYEWKDGAVTPVDQSKVITSVDTITVPATTVGTVPTLPTTVNVTLGDGTTKAANITWNEAATSADTYATAGTVTINGTLADYDNYAVSASVTVNPAELAVSSVSAINADNTITALSGATVRTDISVKVDFSLAIAEADVTATNFQLQKSDGTIVPVRLVQSDDKKTVTMIPTAALASNTNYKVVVAAGINGRDGQSQLATASTTTFATADVVTVSGLKANGVDVDTSVVKGIFSGNVLNTQVLTLSLPTNLDPTTVNGINVKVIDKNGNQVPAVVAYNDTNKVVNIQLGMSLGSTNDTANCSIVANNLKTADGKAVQNYKYDFTVSTDYAPVVQLADGTAVNANAGVYGRLSTENYAGTRRVGFKLNVAFRAALNGNIQDMQADTLNSNNVWLEETASGAKVDTTLSYDAGSRVLSIMPNADLKEDTQYRLVILPDVRNSVGLKAEAVNQVVGIGGSGQAFGTRVGSTRYAQTFTTGYFVRPTIADSSIKQGATDVSETTNTLTVRFDKNLNGLPAVNTMIANKAIKLVDNSLNDEEIDLGTGAGTGNNTATVTVVGNTLNLQFTGGGAAGALSGLVDVNNNINGAAYNAVTNNRRGHTFTLFVAGETLGANALRDVNGNPMGSDYKLTFSVPATDTVAPTVSSVKAMSNEDGTGSTQYKVDLSKTAVVSNVQGNGTAQANEALQVVYSERMGASAALAANYTIDVDTTGDGVFGAGDTLGTVVATATNPSGDAKTYIVTPTAITDIPNNSRVRLNIAAAVADTTGNQIGSVQQYVFTTGAGPVLSTTDGDVAGPDVASTPLPFTSNVAIDGTRNAITIAFDTLGGNAGNVSATTLTSDYIVVKDKTTGDVVAGKLYSDAGCTLPVVANTNIAYFEPDNAWDSGKTYTVTLKAGIKDATLGNVSKTDNTYEFTTRDNSTVPTVTSTSVTNNQGGVAVDSTFTVKFSVPMDKATVEAAASGVPTNVRVLAEDGTALAGTVVYDTTSNQATFTPANYLAAGVQYTLRVTPGVQAASSGLGLSQNNDVIFGTSSTAKLPTITSVKYTDNTAADSDRITITFDKAVDTTATTAPAAGSFNIAGGTLAGGATYTFSADGKTLVISAIPDAGTSIVPDVTTFQINTGAGAGVLIKSFDNDGTGANTGEFNGTDTITVTQ